MLDTPLLHPEILRVLATAGHHARVLIANGNYPASTKRGPRAELVSLQLSPGIPTVAQVFGAVLATVRIDEVHCMGVNRNDPYAAAQSVRLLRPAGGREHRRLTPSTRHGLS